MEGKGLFACLSPHHRIPLCVDWPWKAKQMNRFLPAVRPALREQSGSGQARGVITCGLCPPKCPPRGPAAPPPPLQQAAVVMGTACPSGVW